MKSFVVGQSIATTPQFCNRRKALFRVPEEEEDGYIAGFVCKAYSLEHSRRHGHASLAAMFSLQGNCCFRSSRFQNWFDISAFWVGLKLWGPVELRFEAMSSSCSWGLWDVIPQRRNYFGLFSEIF